MAQGRLVGVFRTAGVAVICLAAGAAATAAIACAAALWSPLDTKAVSMRGDYGEIWARWRPLDFPTRHVHEAGSSDGIGFSRHDLIATRDVIVDGDRLSWDGRRWMRTTFNSVHASVLAGGWTFYHLQVYESGWPFPALHGACAWTTAHKGKSARAHDSIVTIIPQRAAFLRLTQARDLPVRPRWSGFLANTLLFGVPLFLGVIGLKGTRRWLRRKRGCCPHCGYRTGPGPVCTECGRPIRNETASRGRYVPAA